MRFWDGEFVPKGYNRWVMRCLFISVVQMRHGTIFKNLRGEPMKIFCQARLDQLQYGWAETLWPRLGKRSVSNLIRICRAGGCETNEHIADMYSTLKKWANDSRLTFEDEPDSETGEPDNWLLRNAFLNLCRWSAPVFPKPQGFYRFLIYDQFDVVPSEKPVLDLPPWRPLYESEPEFKRRVNEYIEDVKRLYEPSEYERPYEKKLHTHTEAIIKGDKLTKRHVRKQMRASPFWKHLYWLADYQFTEQTQEQIARKDDATRQTLKEEICKIADMIGLELRSPNVGRRRGIKEKMTRRRVVANSRRSIS